MDKLDKYIYGRREKDLKGITYSFEKFRSNLADFLSKADFPVQPRHKDKKGVSTNTYDSFLMNIKKSGIDETMTFEEIDSKVYSTKAVTYTFGREVLTGTFTLALIKKSMDNDEDMSEEERIRLEMRRESSSSMVEGDWNNPEAYTKRKEWILGVKGEILGHYELTQKNDLTVLRNKLIPVFVKEYSKELLAL